MKVVEDRFPNDDGKILVTCIGISSGIGRLIAGPISDFKNVDRIVMQQVYKIIHLNIIRQSIAKINARGAYAPEAITAKTT